MVIFLAGVHGVGKTYLGKPAAEALNLPYATASTLIRAELGVANWNEKKHVQDAGKNQKALISAVNKLLESEGRLILDGHFVLRGANGELNALSADVFKGLKIGGVILIEAPASVIAKRLEARGAPHSVESIEELASAELQQAHKVCQELEVPLVRLHAPSEEEMRVTITNLLVD